MNFDWKSLVGTVAPVIATALGGPLAGLATRAISEAVLGTPDGSEAEIEQALRTADPATLAALKKADQEFAVEMKRLEVEVYRLDTDDRNSARLREVDAEDSWTPRILGVLVVGGFFATVAFTLAHGVAGLSEGQAAFVGTLVGYVSAKAEQVVSYYFGSSAGSKEKTRQLAAIGRK
jgi:hypothetical protein